jgi:adenylate cyclase
MYNLRTPEDLRASGPVILAIDQKALDEADQGNVFGDPYGWPWPRAAWAFLIPYLERHGARGIVFDLFFSEESRVQRELGDDTQLADAIRGARIPLVFATQVSNSGAPGRFGPRGVVPTFGAANFPGGTVREYDPWVFGAPSLGLRAAAIAAGTDVNVFPRDRFRLHYHGPSDAGGRSTYQYVSAGRVVAAAADELGILSMTGGRSVDPEVFRGRMVFVGSTAPGLADLRATPVQGIFPGVEVHVTAMDNLLRRLRVHPVGVVPTAAITLLGAFMASIGVILPRRTLAKLLLAAAAAVLLLLVAVTLFRGRTIRWLPAAVPFLAIVMSTIASFAWSYLTEGRQRQFFFRALSQYLSPDVAAVVERTGELSLSGERRELTVMFTDIQGFTDLSEALEEKITDVLNFYLGEMSAIVYRSSGTLDKYIGDAIMSFWNAPVAQPDHAERACRTALAMKQREREIQPQLAALGAKGMLTRVGLHTGPMTFGNMGSPQKFNYTVIGDAVNLGSRLEGANKLYGSEILISQTTADLVKGQFVFRQLDRLRVKGKKKPMAVYELMAEGQPQDGLLPRVERYERALRCYFEQKWDDAEAELNRLLADFPADLPAQALLKRVSKLRHDPPPPDWDGVYVAKDK